MCGKYEQCDMYQLLAAEMFDVRYQDVTLGQRQAAKAAVFPMRYGIDPLLTGVKDDEQD